MELLGAAETRGTNVAMGVAVFGLMRSGTTLVSDLLTLRGRSIVISEPDLFVPWHEPTVGRVHALLRDFGLPLDPDPPRREDHGNFAAYFERELVPGSLRSSSGA